MAEVLARRAHALGTGYASKVARMECCYARDHICMPVSHKTMLISADVTDQIAAFFKRGEFLRDDTEH